MSRTRELRLPSGFVSALLLLGVVTQILVAQVSFFRTRVPAVGAALPTTPVMTPGIEFVRAHVPAGDPIVYITGDKGVSDLFSYYQMSYSLAPRNAIWWAVPAPAGKVADWWQDARGGSQGIHRLAAHDHARYIVFAGTDVPADLRPSAEWTMHCRFVVVEL